MHTASVLIDKLLEYYKIHTISELAEIIKIGQPAISKWRNNNSINPIKKKCKQLGIYDEIFNEFDSKNDLSNLTDYDNYDKNDYYYKLVQKASSATKDLNKLKNENIIDEATFTLFKEAYTKSLDNANIKEFRIHLMNFTFNYSKESNNIYNHLQSEDDDIDSATFKLFIEAYNVSITNNKLKEFRLHLMEYTFNIISEFYS